MTFEQVEKVELELARYKGFVSLCTYVCELFSSQTQVIEVDECDIKDDEKPKKKTKKVEVWAVRPKNSMGVTVEKFSSKEEAEASCKELNDYYQKNILPEAREKLKKKIMECFE